MGQGVAVKRVVSVVLGKNIYIDYSFYAAFPYHYYGGITVMVKEVKAVEKAGEKELKEKQELIKQGYELLGEPKEIITDWYGNFPNRYEIQLLLKRKTEVSPDRYLVRVIRNKGQKSSQKILIPARALCDLIPMVEDVAGEKVSSMYY